MKRCPGCAAACLDSHRHCPTCGRDVSQVAAIEGDPYVGTTLAGKYHLVELVGSGAMGRVYRADHLSLDAQVAVKMLNPEIASDLQSAKRFQTEARATSRLRHPNTIQILDFGQSEAGALYIVMEFLRGRTLSRVLEEGPVKPRRIYDVLGQALSALDEAHAAGIVHRDFKPENIFIEQLRSGREHVKVLDFGIAKLRGERESQLTAVGMVCGTPEYMSPEQIRGEDLDARSDVYAAGVVLYEMMTGLRPFDTDGPVIELLSAHLSRPPVPPSERLHSATIPPKLEQVCMRALAKNKQERFQSVQELKNALESAVAGVSGEHCKQCGATLPLGARFCHSCGAVLRSSSSFSAAVQSMLGRSSPSDSSEVIGTNLPKLPLPLVGRQVILEQLDGMEKGAKILVGAEGVGKSAVVAHWVEVAETSFHQTVTTGPDPSGARLPLYPFRRAIGQVLQLGERPSLQELEQATEDHPEDRTGLRELFGFGGAASELPLDVRKRECRAAVLSSLRRRGVWIVFEDAHEYDATSQMWLSEFARHVGESTLLVTTTDRTFADLPTLELPALDDAALADLRAIGVPETALAGTAGNPGQIVERLREQMEQVEGGGIDGRLAKLTASVRRLLHVATVAGSDVPTGMMAALADVSDPGRAIAELALRGWLKPGAVATGLEVASPSLRRQIRQAMGDEARYELHHLIAQRLMDRGEDPIVIAFHAEHGFEKSVSLFERAGDSAKEGFDDDAAAGWYRAAMTAADEQADPSGQQQEKRARIALKLARIERYRGRIDISDLLFREVQVWAAEGRHHWIEILALRGILRIALSRGENDRARDLVSTALGIALGGGDPAVMAELYLELADVLAAGGDLARAQMELWEGLLLCSSGEGERATQGPDALWRMCLRLGEIVERQDDLWKARTHGQGALAQADRINLPLGRARAHAFLGRIDQKLGNPSHAAEHYQIALAEMRQLGDRKSVAELLLSLADPKAAARGWVEAWLAQAELLAAQVDWKEGIKQCGAIKKNLSNSP